MTPRLLSDSVLFKRTDEEASEVHAWASGTSTGGPRSNGTYPFTQSDGSVVFLPCPSLFPNKLFIDPTLGNDATGDGTEAYPFKTMAKILTLVDPGDTVQFAKGSVIREQWGMSVNGDGTNTIPLNYYAPDGVVFQNMDMYIGSWTPLPGYPNIYFTKITHNWGSTDNSFAAPGQGFAPQMLVDQTRLIEMQLVSAIDEGNKFTTESDALTSVNNTAGSFYVRGKNGSSMQKGWQAGEQTYFVHTPDGTSPDSHLINIGQRLAPAFAEGSTIKGKVTVFGGVGHNGVVMRRCEVEDMEVWFPCHHATFVVGAHLKRCGVVGSNQTHGGYAYHDFGTSGGYLDCDTVLDDCWVQSWTGAFNSVFGGHGSNDAVSLFVGRQLITNNFGAYDVSAMTIGGGAHVHGAVHRNMSGLSVESISFDDQFTLENCVFIAAPSASSSGGFFRGAGNGTVSGGYTICSRGDIPFHFDGTGTINFVDHHVLFNGDLSNNRWLQVDTGPLVVSFTRCVLQSDIMSAPLGEAANGQITLNFTDCHLSGVAPYTSGNLSVNNYGTVTGGRSGLIVGGDGKLTSESINTVGQLGSDVIDVSSGFLESSAIILTSKGIHHFFNSGIYGLAQWTTPDGVKLNGVGYLDNTNLIFGNAGALYSVAKSDPSISSVVQITNGPNKNWTGCIDSPEGFGYSSYPAFLLADDGSITQYVVTGNVFTPHTTAIHYPLRAGINLDNTHLIAWGDAGVIVSTDGGQTWNNSIANGDATNVASYFNSILSSVACNGQFVLWCKGGIMLTSPTGVSGSWVVHAMPLGQAMVRSMASDDGRKIAIGYADHTWDFNARQGVTRAQSLIELNYTNADPGLWTVRTLPTPLPTLSKIVHLQNYSNGQNGFLIAGKVAQFGLSDDGRSIRLSSLVTQVRTASVTAEKNRIASLQPSA